MNTDKKEFLTPEEVADILKVHPRTVIRWCNNGKIEYIRIGSTIRIPVSAVVVKGDAVGGAS